jgi:hypothetical protein
MRNCSPIYALDGLLYHEIASEHEIANPKYWNAEFQFSSRLTLPIRQPWAELTKEQHSTIQQVRDNNGSQLSTSISPEAIANVVAGRENISPLLNRVQFPCKTIDEETFVETRAKMKDSVGRLIMLDGSLWRECLAPVVCYRPLQGLPPARRTNVWSFGAPHFATPSEFLSPLQKSLHIVCDATETNEGETLAREIAMGQQGTTADDYEIRYMNEQMTVEEPEYLATNSASLGILQCAISASERMAANFTKGKGQYDDYSSKSKSLLNNISAASLDDVLVFKGLVDGIARANANTVDDELADHVRAAMSNPLSFESERDRAVGADIMQACLDRWDNQPINLLDQSLTYPQGHIPKP